jgi:hypothetical protein
VVAMGAASFFLSFLAVGVFGADAITRRFETLPSEQIGASGFLFLLCLGTSAAATFCYAENSRRLGRYSRWFVGLLGGVVAAATFCAAVSAGYYAGDYVELGLWWAWLTLVIGLPILVGWYWPFFSARLSARQISN